VSSREPFTLDELHAIIARAHWQSAKSTEDVAPHQYVVLGWDKDDLTDEEFWRFEATIKAKGRLEEWTPPEEWVRRWGGRPMTNRYLYVGDGYAYWFTWPRDRVPMLNREHVSVQEQTPTRQPIAEQQSLLGHDTQEER
jgi:hypothetical protein